MIKTIDIDEDVIAAIEKLVHKNKVGVDQIMSDLIMEASNARRIESQDKFDEFETVGGFRPFPSRGVVVTDEQVDMLREQENI